MRRFDTIFQAIHVEDVDVEITSVASKGSVSVDVSTTAGAAPLGTTIIAMTPVTDATSLDDLMFQVMVVATDTLRFTAQNPTAGAIDPDEITFRMVWAEAINSDLLTTEE